jgi:BolA protein
MRHDDGQSAAAVNTVTAAQVEAALQAALAPSRLAVRDDSHLHAGHAGAREGRHFSIQVESARFAGLSRVARHRLVYHALADLIAHGIHALAIEADAPGG